MTECDCGTCGCGKEYASAPDWADTFLSELSCPFCSGLPGKYSGTMGAAAAELILTCGNCGAVWEETGSQGADTVVRLINGPEEGADEVGD